MANGNTRLALDYLSSFIGSSRIDVAKTFENNAVSGDYTIPEHEFLRGVLYGNNKHYTEETSGVPNIFHAIQPGRSIFCNIFIIEHMILNGGIANRYISLNEITRAAIELGFSIEVTRSSIFYMIKNSMIEPLKKNKEEQSFNELRVSRAGYYLSKYLILKFPYLECLSKVARIDCASTIEGIPLDDSLVSRFSAATKFISYLDNVLSKDSLLADKILWQQKRTAIEQEFNRINEKLGGRRR
jgi:hypothetical protein